eukprot:Sdes_comp14755_c0_seq1m3564
MQSTPSQTIRIGTRKSQLALIQAETIQKILKKHHAHLSFDLVTMETIGDKILDISLSKIGEKSLFTKELEIALENGTVDMIVHSLKDLPTLLPPGMMIGAVHQRDSPYDCVIFHPKHISKYSSLSELPVGSVIGTSSQRRIAQLRKAFPHLKFRDIRGNINTRISKLENDSAFDAIILAVAGLERMNLHQKIHQKLTPPLMMYAVSQGALAIECKSSDEHILQLLQPLNHHETFLVCTAERSFMRYLEGGCSVPLGVHSEYRDDNIMKLSGIVVSIDGKDAVSCESCLHVSTPQEAEELGQQLGEALLKAGAARILSEFRKLVS